MALSVVPDVQKLSTLLSNDDDYCAALLTAAMRVRVAVQQWLIAWNHFSSLERRPTNSNTPRSLRSSSLQTILAFGLLHHVGEGFLRTLSVTTIEMLPDAQSMFRWTSVILWLLETILNSTNVGLDGMERHECIGAISFVCSVACSAAESSKTWCPLRSHAVCTAAHRVRSRLLPRCDGDESTGRCRLMPPWSKGETALARSRVAQLGDAFRVSFHHYDVQQANNRVLEALNALSGADPKQHVADHPQEAPSVSPSSAVSVTLKPLLDCGTFLPKSAIPYMTATLYIQLHTYPWRFSAGWLAAAVQAANCEQCIGNTTASSSRAVATASTALELFVARIIDHVSEQISKSADEALEYCRAQSVDPWSTASNDPLSLALLVRQVLMAFLVYVWDPIPSCLQAAAGGLGRHANAKALLETISCSVVSLFASQLISLAVGHKTDPSSTSSHAQSSAVTVGRLAATASGLNVLQRIIAEERRLDVDVRRRVLETLSLSR